MLVTYTGNKVIRSLHQAKWDQGFLIVGGRSYKYGKLKNKPCDIEPDMEKLV
jgi:hypothetical protein